MALSAMEAWRYAADLSRKYIAVPAHPEITLKKIGGECFKIEICSIDTGVLHGRKIFQLLGHVHRKINFAFKAAIIGIPEILQTKLTEIKILGIIYISHLLTW